MLLRGGDCRMDTGWWSVAAAGRWPSVLYEVNHQLESRMREIRLSGSEGGGATNRLSLPLSDALPIFGFLWTMP